MRCEDAGAHLSRAASARDDSRRAEELELARGYLRKLWRDLKRLADA